MCRLSPPDRIFTDVRVRKQLAAACLFEHRIDEDKVGAVYGPTAEACEMLYAWRVAVPHVDDVSACESIDIFDVEYARRAARRMTLIGVAGLVGSPRSPGSGRSSPCGSRDGTTADRSSSKPLIEPPKMRGAQAWANSRAQLGRRGRERRPRRQQTAGTA